MLNGLSLFSGIGGIDLALSEWVRPVAYCEIEPYAAGVLFSRMLDGSLPTAPIWPDIKTLRAEILPAIDIVYGGFPCQDLSCAGRQAGLSGERSGLFFEIVRLVSECKPVFIFLENVPAIKPYRPDVFAAFENLGYDCRDGTLAAGQIGACHLRNRWWFLAHSCGQRRQQIPGGAPCHEGTDERGSSQNDHQLAGLVEDPTTDASRGRCQQGDVSERREAAQERERGATSRSMRWPTEPPVCGADDVIQRRVDRIKCLGNAVHVSTAKEAFKRLMGVD